MARQALRLVERRGFFRFAMRIVASQAGQAAAAAAGALGEASAEGERQAGRADIAGIFGAARTAAGMSTV